ncbi:MAG: hypothetical protein U0521_16270 [Anaerolineae bacterium]
MIAGQYQVVKFNCRPPSIRRDLPTSLNWTFDPAAEAAERVYTFTHEQTGTQYTPHRSSRRRSTTCASGSTGRKSFSTCAR